MPNMQRSQQTRELIARPVPPHTAPMAREPGVYNIVRDAKRGHIVGLAVTCPCGCRTTRYFNYDPASLFNDIASLEPVSLKHPVEFGRDHFYHLQDGVWYAR